MTEYVYKKYIDGGVMIGEVISKSDDGRNIEVIPIKFTWALLAKNKPLPDKYTICTYINCKSVKFYKSLDKLMEDHMVDELWLDTNLLKKI